MQHLRVLDRELEHDVLVGQRLVDLGECVQLGLHVDQVLGVKEHLQHLGAINLVSNALANNLGRIYDVLKSKKYCQYQLHYLPNSRRLTSKIAS